MLINSPSSQVPNGRFPSLKKAESLRELKRQRFSGQRVVLNSAGQPFNLYFFRGLLLYATDGTHRVRRWRRNLAIYCPHVSNFRLAWQRDLDRVDAQHLSVSWEYALLCLWIKQQKITHTQALKVVHTTLVQVLLELEQVEAGMEQTMPFAPAFTPSVLVELDDVITEAQSLRQAWHHAKLSLYSPEMAPLLRHPEHLQKNSSAELYQTLSKLLNGQHTLYDLAAQTRRDVVEVTTSLLPYIQMGWVELVDAPELPAPIYHQDLPEPRLPVRSSPALLKPAIATTNSQAALIACVDDSQWIRQTMEQVVTSVGYRFLGVEDPLRAIGTLLSHKPDLIFLDLVMPDVNGYEICEQLRKLSCFRNTPIVILTGNDGLANRLKSSFAGATDFLTKPLDVGAVLKTVFKHVQPDAIDS